MGTSAERGGGAGGRRRLLYVVESRNFHPIPRRPPPNDNGEATNLRLSRSNGQSCRPNALTEASVTQSESDNRRLLVLLRCRQWQAANSTRCHGSDAKMKLFESPREMRCVVQHAPWCERISSGNGKPKNRSGKQHPPPLHIPSRYAFA